MEIINRLSDKEFSQRKLAEYEKVEKIVNWGRQNPVRFAEEVYGLKLIDYQKWCFMETWTAPFALWLLCRGAGKDTVVAVYLQTKMLLIPNYKVYISSNTHPQSVESFQKLEDIALQRLPSFKSATDVFAREIERSANSETGFLHNPAGYTFRLYNNSQLTTLSNNSEGIRGKRGSVWLNEVGWKTAEELAVVENFINVDSSFSTSTSKIKHIDPMQMPLQLLYTSSASDATYPFYEKYRSFFIKMLAGDRKYFVCDLDANDILHYSTIDGEPIKAHLTEEQVQKAIDEDPDAADRELFNLFRKGSGQNAVVKMETIVNNSTIRKPLLFNDTGKKKFIFCYDPARNFDGSILSVFQVIDDKNVGYKLQLENVVSMVDTETKKKTPLPMPQQLEIIKKLMLKYNGERSAEWENIEFYIDAGSGGGGVSAVADQLMDDWVDEYGQKHRGIIDPDHKQYETARNKYSNAMPIVHLIDPQGYKKIIYDALEKMTKLNLINFTDYDGKDYLMLENDKGEFYSHPLSGDERMALIQINLAKNEMAYMCRYDTPSGGVQYELAKDKKNTMHDDRAYTTAMAAFALAMLRRTDLVNEPKRDYDYSKAPSCVSAISF